MPNILVGTISASAPTNAQAGVTSSTLVAQNLDRVGLVIVNVSISTVYLGFQGQTAVLNSGVVLTPNGGTWTMDDYTFNNEAMTGISHATGSIVSIQEFVRR